MATKERPPHIEVHRTKNGLRPLTASDAEALAMIPDGARFSLEPISKRSWPQLKTYWKALGMVARVSGKWASAENLHRDLKMTLGYREQSINLQTGEIYEVPDSIALNKMSQEEFNVFFQQAMALISESVGFDPLAFLSEAA